jgi:hypothetical protein
MANAGKRWLPGSSYQQWGDESDRIPKWRQAFLRQTEPGREFCVVCGHAWRLELQVVESPGSHIVIQFAVAGTDLYCIRFDRLDAPISIDVVDLRTTTIRRVLNINAPQRQNSPGLSISPDRKWFLYALMDFEDDLMQFENFR